MVHSRQHNLRNPPGLAVGLYDRQALRGTEAGLVRYPEERHGVCSLSTAANLHTRVFACERHLM